MRRGALEYPEVRMTLYLPSPGNPRTCIDPYFVRYEMGFNEAVMP